MALSALKRAAEVPFVAVLLLATTPAWARPPLGFEERVALAEKVERIVDAHREWPKDNGPVRPFESRHDREALARRVEMDLRRIGY